VLLAIVLHAAVNFASLCFLFDKNTYVNKRNKCDVFFIVPFFVEFNILKFIEVSCVVQLIRLLLLFTLISARVTTGDGR
jgi:hypothetical protein